MGWLGRTQNQQRAGRCASVLTELSKVLTHYGMVWICCFQRLSAIRTAFRGVFLEDGKVSLRSDRRFSQIVVYLQSHTAAVGVVLSARILRVRLELLTPVLVPTPDTGKPWFLVPIRHNLPFASYFLVLRLRIDFQEFW